MGQVEEFPYCQFIDNECIECLRDTAPNSMFFGYPSQPQPEVDAIQNAIKKVRDDDDFDVTITDWKELPIEGNIVFCEICKAIRSSNLAALNVANANFNVLFEFGFAIGLGKAIWPLLQKGIEKRNYLDTKTLNTIGYFEFTDSKSIVKKMGLSKPWTRTSRIPSLPTPLGLEITGEAINVLYIKSPHPDEPSSYITDTLKRRAVGVITDNPNEVPRQPLFWYLTNIGEAYAVIIDLGSGRAIGIESYRSKCALVAGLSLALGRRLLITGEDIQLEPIDYRDLVKGYKGYRDAQSIVKEFVEKVESTVKPYYDKQKWGISKPRSGTTNVLDDIDLGDYNADNEVHLLGKYFVDPPQFIDAIKPKFKIYVGRKGSGKSANFYMVADRLASDKRNVVCQIQPKHYELNELIELVKEISDNVKTDYMLESLWKYLLYSEALKTVFKTIRSRPSRVGRTDVENEIERYVEDRKNIFNLSFTARLVYKVDEFGVSIREETEKVHISELLHSQEITEIEKLLCDFMKANVQRFGIMIDQLDANWQMGEDHEIMSDILLALFDAAREMWRSCQKHMKGLEPDRGLSIHIFIRSDVFNVVYTRAREPDKLEYELLSWTEAYALLQLINKRIQVSTQRVDNWDNILEPAFPPEEMVNWLRRNMLLRPRDIILLFKQVLYNARGRGSDTISKRDFSEAITAYSEYATGALKAESQPYIPEMEDL